MASIMSNRRVTTASTLKDQLSGLPIASKVITFYHRKNGTTAWTQDASKTTGTNGSASNAINLKRGSGTYDFQTRFAGIPNQYDPVDSAIDTVSV